MVTTGRVSKLGIFWAFLENFENRQNHKNLGIFSYTDINMTWEPHGRHVMCNAIVVVYFHGGRYTEVGVAEVQGGDVFIPGGIPSPGHTSTPCELRGGVSCGVTFTIGQGGHNALMHEISPRY
jgi:hypothetical protein